MKILHAGVSVLKAACLTIQTEDLYTGVEETELCIARTKQLLAYVEINQSSQQVLHFTGWLLSQLESILLQASKSIVNQSLLWTQYHKLRCSAKKWTSFLLSAGVTDSPLLYQVLSTRMLDYIIQTKLPCPEPCSNASQCDAAGVAEFTYEEKNTIRYIGGYIVSSLKKQHVDEDILIALCDLLDGEAEESEEWTGSIDRGGLIYIYECDEGT